MSKRTRNFWIEAGLLVLIAASVASALIASEMQPLNKSDIKMHVGDLRSFAAAGRQLVEQKNRGQFTAQFFESEESLLAEKVSTTAKTLRDTKTEANAEAPRQMARALADELEAAVRSMTDTNGLADAAKFDRLKNECKQLEDRKFESPPESNES